ncbi:MAG: hypothetical protein SH856_03060 [Flavobacteriales bacterium]|nr:hypothetical protein [Flavobacteriales bacterium]
MNNKLYIGIIVVLLAAVGVLAYKYYTTEQKVVYLSAEYTGLDTERQALAVDLEQMRMSYDTLSTDNDSMLTAIESQRAEIEGLLSKVKDKNYDVSKLKKEAETLRGIMKGYIHDIDSLNQLADRLVVERDTERGRADQATATVKEQEEFIKTQEGVINTANVMQASSFSNTGIQLRSNGKQDDTDRASRSEMIKSCFTVRKNSIVKPGSKNIFLRIVGPDAKVLPNKEGSITIQVDGKDELYSVSREIDYQREDQDVCVFYTVQEELKKGNYKVYVYEGGMMIGQSELALR